MDPLFEQDRKETDLAALSELPNGVGLTSASLEFAKEQHRLLREFVAGFLVKGEDFGPGRGSGGGKDVLLKPGAEKLCKLFKLRPNFRDLEVRNDFECSIFFYRYACDLYHIPSGQLVGSGIGSCNSKEKKYRYRWVNGKQVENDQVADLVNTLDKMAQKRALLAAVLIAVAGSDLYTQDYGDNDEELNERTGEVKTKAKHTSPTAAPVPAPSSTDNEITLRGPPKAVTTAKMNDQIEILEKKIREVTSITFQNPDELLAELLGIDTIDFNQLHKAKPTEARFEKVQKAIVKATKTLVYLEKQRGPGEQSEVAK